ncbi:MAG: hypothetical protein N3D73_01990 [Candidatus Diapherotrites archaeon]|nr:hypothetical protein [Candidatus Diapherotrites archaeon]
MGKSIKETDKTNQKIIIEELSELISKEKRAQLLLDKELDYKANNYSVLILTEPEDYSLVRNGLLKKFSGYNLLYVLSTFPFCILEQELVRHKVDYSKFLFLDLISKTTNSNIIKKDNIFYLDSPSDLTELSMKIEDHVKQNIIIILDSVSALLIYNDSKSVEKLVHFIVGKSAAINAKFVMLMSKSPEYKGVIDVISQFCNKVCKIEKIV